LTQDNEFDQFVDFVTHFSTELSSGNSPEYALLRTMNYFGRQTPIEIARIVKDIIEGTKSFHVAWSDLVKEYENDRNSRLVELLGRFIDKGSIVGGERMLLVLKQVRKNSAITKNRKNLVSGQKVKVTALSIVSSVVIGMIAALAPILSLAFVEGFLSSPGVGNSSSFSFSILLALFLTVVITGYRLSQTVGGARNTILLSTFAFTSTYILINHLLMTLL
jgi:hypothetical protein